MGDESDEFYVVRKGDIFGVYKSLSDLQSMLRSPGYDPSVSVFKGYGLSKDAEEYLATNGLKNAVHCINARDVQDDLFGQVIPCPFRQPNSSHNSKDKATVTNTPEKRMQAYPGSGSTFHQAKHAKLDNFLDVAPVSYCPSCTMEFDGASKGNPGLAGAGAVLRVGDGRVFRLREGLGIATNNVSEYRGLILGLKYALQKGFKHITVQGDSKLVCMQIQGLWKTKNQNMAELCKVAKELKEQFVSFQIKHIDREFNKDADLQANEAVHIKNGEIQADCEMK
ncbi:hypothetical protein Leryth_019944 [Lithospermum erythrorhizon]|uniref:RNA processing factor n=1 Tax=Lithospermum erythrorhizon TaxID=34254 RepID=A0AAV3NSJ1_LITER|nr:hypothetical protein Leryth_019944 [Lithospermum erythrorhizon]